MPESWVDFFYGPLPAFAVLMSYLFLLPGGFLIFLASRNIWACWAARILWSFLWMAGPLIILVMSGSDFHYSLRGGGVLWLGGAVQCSDCPLGHGPKGAKSGRIARG